MSGLLEGEIEKTARKLTIVKTKNEWMDCPGK